MSFDDLFRKERPNKALQRPLPAWLFFAKVGAPGWRQSADSGNLNRVDKGAAERVVSKANHQEQGTAEGTRESQATCE